MPAFLTSIGFSVLWIGLLEGMAEAAAGLTKGYFGNLSDHFRKRLPFVQLGYFFSAVSKPLIAGSVLPLWIFGCRLIDRIGKGLRTAPRDAILSSESSPETKGSVFGFHRALDTLGAVLGPAMALLWLHHFPGQYRELFLVAFIPGMLAVLLTFGLREKAPPPITSPRPGLLAFTAYWKNSNSRYRTIAGGLLFFALINSSDLFLILRARDAGLSDTNVISIYIFYNLIYSMFAYPAGRLADRIGLKNMLVIGVLIFSGVYSGMMFDGSATWHLLLFFLYGLYAACTESIGKALIANSVPASQLATAIGTFHAFQSLAALISSSLAGLVWHLAGPQWLFGTTGFLALGIALYFGLSRPSRPDYKAHAS